MRTRGGTNTEVELGDVLQEGSLHCADRLAFVMQAMPAPVGREVVPPGRKHRGARNPFQLFRKYFQDTW